MKKHNFYAGPAILPEEVLEGAAEAVKSFNGTGLSLVEVSHRSKEFVEIMENAKQLVKDLFTLGDDFEVLFLQGGASLQFCMVPYNLLSPTGSAGYIDTGMWAKKAIKEASLFGNCEVLASSADSNYNYIPRNFEIPNGLDYFHITSNNTIFGTEINDLNHFTQPVTEKNIPIVADMSSDIFSRPIDADKFGLIYAGAQKNMGPSGTTLVIVNKNILTDNGRDIPTLLNYNTHIDKKSMFNTPPVFSVYTSYLTLKWIKENGGLEKMGESNHTKANLLYNEIDNNGLFEGTANREDRSLMNVTFVLKDTSLESEFLDICSSNNIVGIKGHRSVGGFRASIYNAMPLPSVKVLTDIMKTFGEKYG